MLLSRGTLLRTKETELQWHIAFMSQHRTGHSIIISLMSLGALECGQAA